MVRVHVELLKRSRGHGGHGCGWRAGEVGVWRRHKPMCGVELGHHGSRC